MENEPSKKRGLPLWASLSLAAGIFFLFFAIFMEVKAGRELGLAREALPKSEEAAVRHYFQAINWYAPWGSSQKAAEELWALAERRSNEGKGELAYQAFLRLRGALYAARSFYLPRKDILAACNGFLAGYLADKKIAFHGGLGNRDELYARYHKIYGAAPDFSEFFAFLAVSSFLGWVFFFAKILFSFFGGGGKEPLKLKFERSQVFIVLFVVCYLAWVFSMTAA
jgi:hypothetical protein